MEALKALLRLFTYLFHLALGCFLLGVSGLALGSGPHVLNLELLPWSGATLAVVLLLGALVGLTSVVLAITGKARLLLLAWSLLVAVVLLKSYVFSGYRFAPGGASAQIALELLVASWLAVVGAWFVLRRPARYRY